MPTVFPAHRTVKNIFTSKRRATAIGGALCKSKCTDVNTYSPNKTDKNREAATTFQLEDHIVSLHLDFNNGLITQILPVGPLTQIEPAILELSRGLSHKSSLRVHTVRNFSLVY